MNHSDEEISENVQAVVKKLKERFPGGWKNIKSINIKTSDSISIPIYVSLGKYNLFIY